MSTPHFRGRQPLLFATLAFLFACQSVGTTTAILYNDQGKYNRAISVARQVINQHPDDAEAHFQLGLAFSHLDSVSEAYFHFNRAIELDPENLRRTDLVENNLQHNFARHYAAGQAEFARGSYAGAARAFRAATAADPRRGLGYYHLGVTYVRLAEGAPGFRDDAIAAFETAVRKSTPDDTYHTRAVAAMVHNYVKLQSWEDAVRWGERYVAIDPGNTDMWRLLSDCHERLGNEKQARECLVRSREVRQASPASPASPQ